MASSDSPAYQNNSRDARVHLIEVDGARLTADVRDGTAPQLVFLHYWGGTRRTWRSVLERLPGDWGYVAYDQRGWGESASAAGPYGMQQLADDAQAVIASQQYPSYVVVGHSMGGKAALALAARRPAGLAGVVLVAPAPPAPVGFSAELQRLTLHAYDDEAAVRRSIGAMLTHRDLDEQTRRQIVDDSLSASTDARLAWPTHGLVEDVSAGLPDIDVPVLILAGDQDKVEPPEILSTHLLPQVSTARMEILEDTGHLSPLEIPDTVAAHITTFVKSLRPQPLDHQGLPT